MKDNVYYKAGNVIVYISTEKSVVFMVKKKI